VTCGNVLTTAVSHITTVSLSVFIWWIRGQCHCVNYSILLVFFVFCLFVLLIASAVLLTHSCICRLKSAWFGSTEVYIFLYKKYDIYSCHVECYYTITQVWMYNMLRHEIRSRDKPTQENCAQPQYTMSWVTTIVKQWVQFCTVVSGNHSI
jgi:hypothetical protein